MKTLKATPNHSKRTFTIRVYYDGSIAKYRTRKFTKVMFEDALTNTENDWMWLLRITEYNNLNL